jgi:hypothetical protein
VYRSLCCGFLWVARFGQLGAFIKRSDTMLVMRPAQMADLTEVQRLAADSPVGVTSLPDDADRLREKIAASEASFAAEVSFNGE